MPTGTSRPDSFASLRREHSGSGMASCPAVAGRRPRQSRADAALAVKRWGVLDGQAAARSREGGSTADGMAGSVKARLTVFLRVEVLRDSAMLRQIRAR